MASFFSELYSEFKDELAMATQDLPINEQYFMRLFTEGVQLFQRKTEYVETSTTLTAVNSRWYLPNACMRVLELADSDGAVYLSQDYQQFQRAQDTDPLTDTPYHHSERLPSDCGYYTIFNREILLNDTLASGLSLVIKYIPNFEAYSQNSIYWTAWFPVATNFDTLFRTMSLTPTLAPYELAFINYAIARIFKVRNQLDQYAVYMQDFNSDVLEAIERKPIYTKESSVEYNFSPYMRVPDYEL